MHGHVRKNSSALVTVRSGIGILERRVDFENPANGAAFHELFRVDERLVVAPLEGEHKGVRMIAIQFRREFAVLFESSRQRLFEQHAMAGCDQSGGMCAVIVRRGNDHGGIAHVCFGQLFDGRKNRDLKAEFIAQAAGANRVNVGKPGKLTGLRVAGQFV